MPKFRSNSERLRALQQRVTEHYLDKLNPRSLCYCDEKKKFHRKQLKFLNDRSKYKVACTGRRSGKTRACIIDLITACAKNDNIECLYLGLSGTSAMNLIWRDAKRYNDEFHLGARVREKVNTLEFKNGSVLYVLGAKDTYEIDKLLGHAFYRTYIDEAQSFKENVLNKLVWDVIDPTTWDKKGSQIIMTGTPGPVPAGMFYEAAHGIGRNKAWSAHHWNALSNPFIDARSEWEKDKAAKGWTEDHPEFQRTALGNWVIDYDVLVYNFDHVRNIYDELPQINCDWNYVFGIDTGYNDANAIVVLAFCDELPNCYLVDEFIKDKQSMTELVEQINEMQETYDPILMVIDPAGAGKVATQEYYDRYGVVLEIAEKQRKNEFIRYLNDDLMTGRLLIPRGSQVIEDMLKIQWKDPTAPIRTIDRAVHSDVIDAMLYAWRACRHYLYEPEDLVIIEPGSREWYDKQIDAMHQQEDREVQEEVSGLRQWWEKDYENDPEELIWT